MALAKAGDLEAALPYYDQALQLDPSNADALVARGAALANRQQWQRASGARLGLEAGVLERATYSVQCKVCSLSCSLGC